MKTPAVFVLLLACCVSADPLVEVVAKLRADLTALQSLTLGKQVAFSASLVATGGDSQTFGPFEKPTPLVYKHVVTNIGSAYSPDTGNFTAPLKGAYHFEWHVFGGGGPTGAVLVKNSKNIFTAYESQPSDGGASASNGASLLLEAGDVLSVHLYPGTTVHDNTDRLTTFSGHLLFTM